MSDGKLKFVITIDDKGTPIIKDMAGNIQKIEKTTVAATSKMSKGFGSMWKQMALGQAAFAAARKGFSMIKQAIGDSINLAIEAEETHSKFGVVFQDVSNQAAASAKDLADSWGLSKLAAETLLSSTGDLLTGLGLNATAALQLSDKTQKLAIDLASFTNYAGGAKGASEALTKAMLGEREMAKRLGIVLTGETIKQELVLKGKDKLKGMALLQAKAEATLAVAIKQSQNAMGDYKRTADSTANVLKRIGMVWEDIKVTIGEAILETLSPMFKDLIKYIEKNRDKIEEFGKKVGETIGSFITGIKNVIGFLIKWKDTIAAVGKIWLFYFAISKIILWKTAFVGALVAVKTKMLLMNVGLQGIITNMKFLQLRGASTFGALGGSLKYSINKMGALGKAIAIAGAAYAGWTAGRWIGKNTGLDEYLQREMSASLQFFGLLQKEKAELSEVSKARGESIDTIRNMGKELGTASDILSVNALAIYKNKEAYDKLEPAIKKIVDGFVGHNKAVQEAAAIELKAAELAAEKLKKLELEKIAIEKTKKAAQEMRKEMEKYASSLGILTKQGYGELRKETDMFIRILKENKNQYENNAVAMGKVQKKAKEYVAIYENAKKIVPAGLKEIIKETKNHELSMLSQIDQLKILDMALSLTGKSYTGLSVNLQDVTKKTNDFELSMLSEVDQLNIASGVAQMMGLSLLGINIPMVDLSKNTVKAATDSEKLAAKLELIANAASSLKGLLNKLGIETGGVADGFVDLASGAATLAAGIAAKDPAAIITGLTQAISGLIEIFKSRGIEQAIERENRWMDMNDSLKESLKELAKEMGNTHAATSTMLADIMADSDITVQNFDKWAGRVKEIFIDLQNGYISIDEFMKTMGSSWNKLVEEAQRLGTEGSKEMLEIIREMENKGLKVAEISEYRIGQLKDTAQALQDYALAGGKNIESYSSSLFAMLQKEGVGLTEIAEIMGSNLPAGLRKFIDENENALNVISSTQKMMEGLGNSAYLTQEIFNQMQGDIIRAYDSMTEGGKNQEQSLRAVAPALAKELWYAQQYNYTLDAKTQKMIDDAKAAGINLDNMKTQQQLQTEMNHSLKQLVDVMEEFVGATRAGNNELSDMATTARGIDFNPGDIPRGGSKGGIPEFAEGGHFWVDKPMYIKVGEKTREEVIIRPEGKTMGGDTIMEKHVHLHLDNVNDINTVGKIRYALEHDGEFRGVIASAGDN